jgi:hypothetical protein
MGVYAPVVTRHTPVTLRRGAVVRVAAGRPEDVASMCVHALSSVDLRFPDDHTERWLGPGALYDAPEGSGLRFDELVPLGERVAEEQGITLFAEVRQAFRDFDRDAFDSAPVEVVLQWNAEMPNF